MSSFLHTMLRVGDLDRSVDFYTRLLGMKELRRNDVPDGKYTLVFVGFAPESTGAGVIELTYNYGVEKYEMGTAFGHIAIGVPDIYATCEGLRAAVMRHDEALGHHRQVQRRQRRRLEV